MNTNGRQEMLQLHVIYHLFDLQSCVYGMHTHLSSILNTRLHIMRWKPGVEVGLFLTTVVPQ
jgi:hypothetical protein